jgi:methionyl-tRNA formyltransferase
LKIIFAGTPEFAAASLKALLDAGFDVVAVLTQPDRPAGRGMQLIPGAVKQLALQRNLIVLQPATLKSAEIQSELAGFDSDVMVVAAYGLILPEAVLNIPRRGCLNIHASLLPRWRGAAPIQRAILAGDEETGITIMQMDAGLDTGGMLIKRACAISPTDNGATLHDKLAALGASSIVEALHLLQDGKLQPVPQDNAQATYAAKLSKAEALIDWSRSATHLDCAIRAYNPFPVSNTVIHDTPVRIWQASVRSELNGNPGTVLAVEKSGVMVACGEGALNLEVLQRPNAKALPAAQFIQGFAIRPGDKCISPA